jgi:hypothetical protein
MLQLSIDEGLRNAVVDLRVTGAGITTLGLANGLDNDIVRMLPVLDADLARGLDIAAHDILDLETILEAFATHRRIQLVLLEVEIEHHNAFVVLALSFALILAQTLIAVMAMRAECVAEPPGPIPEAFHAVVRRAGRIRIGVLLARRGGKAGRKIDGCRVEERHGWLAGGRE